MAVFDENKIDKLVTREELYFVIRQMQNLILALRYENTAMRIGGPSIADAVDSFQTVEKKLEGMLNRLAFKDEEV